ncbi:proton-coupled amino acid transporter-like protein CG1139 [Cephus cinctus]|uniref:Proton-coupled amino acid transporter-like protein CG1139 n=1 Tax=Cephus cinctus TaxID=211228 RepID=A0AAJ7RLV9_CEPCN|nr:proton-coupled amino acid transporter-like protein CG1139 [Cephus cinctus]
MTDKEPNDKNDTVEDVAYDPYEHREVDGRTLVSDFGSWANLVKSAVGTGLFAMPHAFACVGILVGIIGTIIMGVLITISLHLLVQAHYKVCVKIQKPALSYSELVTSTMKSGPRRVKAAAEWTIFVVDVIMLMCYIGIGSIYVVFIAGVVQECLDSNKTISQGYYALILIPFFLVMNMIKHLKALAPFSMLGNLFLLIAAIIGVVYSLKDGIGNEYEIVRSELNLYPKFLGTVFFSMCSPGLILSIENSMKNPENYNKPCGVFNLGMSVVIIIHVLIGSIGYLKWGPDSRANFIRNHLENDVATVIALVFQALAIYFSYGLQCYMPISILHEDYALPGIEEGDCAGTSFLWDQIIRISVTLITCILAATIPKLDIFIGLVGAFSMTTLGVVIPVALYLIVYLNNFGRYRWRFVLGIFLLFVGLTCMICATVTSMILIVRFFKYG